MMKEKKESSFTAEKSPMEEAIAIQRAFRKQGSPSPFSRPMTPSMPLAQQRPNTLPKRVDIHTQAASPLQQGIPKNENPILKIIPKYYKLQFDGKKREIFIKRVKNIAEIDGENGRDIARKMLFWTKDQNFSYHIKGLPRYGTGDWEKLKMDIKERWGIESPYRR
ncbi:hypothetical protein O181_012974 [Austropuccinia psidii MF-1]|uniref:Uncharacterized protein n=1 Tax=Austropuccinia psidii MF-1 TaxID=1389203 RepID=A0A9Q3GND8_9BASI|nr:hypothetical protein [Austropuccinia psidii MF-1]